MRKSFVTNLAFLLLLNLLVKPFWLLGIDREVQNLLGSEVYGEYFMLFNFSLLMNILLDLGVTNFNNRNIAQNEQLLSKHLAGIVLIKVLLGLVYFAVMLLAAYILGYSKLRIDLLLFLLLNQFLVSFVLYMRSNIAALHLFKTDAIISIMDRVLMIVLCAAMLWGNFLQNQLKIEHFIYAQTISYGLTAVFSFLLVYKEAPFKKLTFRPAFTLMILKKSFPFAFLVLLMYFYTRMDTIMLDWLLPDGNIASGIYAQGYRLLDAFNMLAFLTAGILYPMFSRMLKNQQPVQPVLKTAFGLLFTGAMSAAVVCWFLAAPIMELLYNQDTMNSSEVFKYLIQAFVPISLSYAFGTLLTANGNLKILNIVAFLGVLVNFSLNYWMINTMGVKGSAIATAITQYLAVIAQIVAVVVIFNIKINWRFLFKVISFLILGVLAMDFSAQLDTKWQVQMLIGLLSFTFLAFATRLVNLKEGLGLLLSNKA